MFDLGLMWAMAEINTGGGSAVGGDVDADSFTGRDKKNFDGAVTFNNVLGGQGEGRKPKTTEERVEWLLIIVDGDQRLGVVGIRSHIRLLRTQLRIMLVILIGVSIVVFAELAAILILLRRLT